MSLPSLSAGPSGNIPKSKALNSRQPIRNIDLGRTMDLQPN